MIFRHQSMVLLICVLLCGCASSKAYKAAVTANTIPAYEAFLAEYPKGSHTAEVTRNLAVLRETAAWNKAQRMNSAMEYDTFIDRYPTSVHVPQAIEQIKKLNEESAWYSAQTKNTISGYQAFLATHGHSGFTTMAQDAIRALEHEAVWKQVEQSGSTSVLEAFILANPNSPFIGKARSLLEEMKYIAPAWERATALNTIDGYEAFRRQYPNSTQASGAKVRIEQLQRGVWERAASMNTVQGYRAYLAAMPRGMYAKEAEERIEVMLWDHAVLSNTIKAYQAYLDGSSSAIHASEAEKKIIDLEVDAIFKGDHGQLPPMNRSSSGYAATTENNVKIFNNTGYTLTVRYSGAESERIVLAPKQRSTVVMPNGTFRITASVNASNVRNYAGTEKLTGADYESEYYIVTQ